MIVLFAGIFAVNAISHYQRLNNQKDSQIKSMQQAERTIAALLDGFASDLESFSLSTAITLGESGLPIEADALDTEGHAAVNGFLQHLFDSYEILRSIFITDPQGRVVYSDSGENIGLDLSDRSYVQALQGGAEIFWSEGFPGLESGRTIVTHGRSITNSEGETSGFLFLAFHPESLAQRLPPNIAGEGHISLFDQQGQLILRVPAPDEGLPPASTPVSSNQLDAARAGEHVVLQSMGPPLVPGDNYVALGRLNKVDWVVGYSLPSSAITGRANAIFQRDLLILMVLMLGGLAVALYMGSLVAQPLTRLGRVAQAIARGERADELDDIRTTEVDLAALASTIRQMKSSIQLREEQLSLQAAVIESIERTGESLASELDVEKTVNAVIEAGVKLTNAQAALFVYRRAEDEPFESVSQSVPGQVELTPDSATVEIVLRGQTVHVADVQERPAPKSAEQAAPAVLREPNRRNGANGEPVGARSVLGVPVQSPGGQITGALILMHSATGVFNLQDLRMTRGLARWAGIVLENAELFRRCQEIQEMLQQANEDKDEFLAMVSHELRTPITTIYGGSRLLRLRRRMLTDEAINDMINAVADEAEQLYHLVEDLLTLARTESLAQVEREPISLYHVLHQVTEQYTRNHARDVQLKIPEDFPPVLGDQTYLTQVLSNLISNADKYSPAGLAIEVEATHDADGVTVRVRDHGPGVREEELGLIFERFFRSETSSGLPGKGLGLTVCKRLIEALHGEIEARNAPDGGLEVKFSLELAEDVALIPGHLIEGGTQ